MILPRLSLHLGQASSTPRHRGKIGQEGAKKGRLLLSRDCLGGMGPRGGGGVLNQNKTTEKKTLGLFIYSINDHGGHRLNIELDLQSLFGLLCTAVLIG